MKVKVTLSSEDGIQWDAEAKDIGLVATGASMMSALEQMEENIKEFFADAFDSKKKIEVVCSKIKATAAVTVSPLDPRPEQPLDTFCQVDPLLIEGQDLIEGKNQLSLPPGEEEIEIEYDDVIPPNTSGNIIDAEFSQLPQIGAVGE